jgi:hypothetical protein
LEAYDLGTNILALLGLRLIAKPAQASGRQDVLSSRLAAKGGRWARAVNLKAKCFKLFQGQLQLQPSASSTQLNVSPWLSSLSY